MPNKRQIPYIISVCLLLILLLFIHQQVNEVSLKTEKLEIRLNELAISSKERKDQIYYEPQNLDTDDDEEKPLVIYNRLPKTGSTTFSKLVYDLSKPNHMYVTHLNTTKNSFRWTVADQYKFVWNVTKWTERRPAVYHGHIGYIPFEQYGAKQPIYINIVREPLDRLVSYYYFLRYGDDFRKGLKRAREGDKTSFDDCVKKRGRDCDTKQLWVQIPFLCGHSAECWELNSEWALQQAKINLLTKYTLVGVTEQMEEFVVLLEATVPKVFRGITDLYRKGGQSHVRKTLHKDPLSKETIKSIQASKTYQMERELYDFALNHFNDMKDLGTSRDENGLLQPLPQKFRYEKIYGPKGKIV